MIRVELPTGTKVELHPVTTSSLFRHGASRDDLLAAHIATVNGVKVSPKDVDEKLDPQEWVTLSRILADQYRYPAPVRMAAADTWRRDASGFVVSLPRSEPDGLVVDDDRTAQLAMPTRRTWKNQQVAAGLDRIPPSHEAYPTAEWDFRVGALRTSLRTLDGTPVNDVTIAMAEKGISVQDADLLLELVVRIGAPPAEMIDAARRSVQVVA